jgi:hypothetical protein
MCLSADYDVRCWKVKTVFLSLFLFWIMYNNILFATATPARTGTVTGTGVHLVSFLVVHGYLGINKGHTLAMAECVRSVLLADWCVCVSLCVW